MIENLSKLLASHYFYVDGPDYKYTVKFWGAKYVYKFMFWEQAGKF